MSLPSLAECIRHRPHDRETIATLVDSAIAAAEYLLREGHEAPTEILEDLQTVTTTLSVSAFNRCVASMLLAALLTTRNPNESN